MQTTLQGAIVLSEETPSRGGRDDTQLQTVADTQTHVGSVPDERNCRGEGKYLVA